MPNQYAPRISDDTVRAILADREAGMGPHGIATKHGCSVSMVSKITTGGTRANVEYRDHGTDMTEGELEALIAEQLPTMPSEPRNRSEPRLPQTVSRGLGIQSRGRPQK